MNQNELSQELEQSPKLNAAEPNKPKVVLTTLADHYRYFYKTIMEKMKIEERTALLENLQRKPQVVRGQEVEYSNVRNFLREVAEQSDAAYDKAQLTK